MRVLHVLPDLDPASGGPVTAVVGMARALSGAGATVRVLASDFGSPRTPGDLDIALFPCRAARWRWTPGLASALADEVGRADIVHVHTLWTHPTLAAGRACRSAGVPYVLRPCGMLDAWSMSRHALRKRLYLALLEDRTIDGAAALHWTSETEREGAVRPGRHAFVLPLGLEEEAFTPGDPAAFRARFPALGERPFALFLGRLNAKKQPGLVVDALAAARRTVPHAMLALAGPASSDERTALEARAREAGLGDAVCFTGLLDGTAVRDALAAASVFVLPSLQENFGLAVAEALAAGCPVVVSPQVGLAREVRSHDAGLVVEPAVDPLASAVTGLFGDESRRRRLGANGRALARNALSWPALAPRLLGQYDDLLRSPRWFA